MLPKKTKAKTHFVNFLNPCPYNAFTPATTVTNDKSTIETKQNKSVNEGKESSVSG